MSDELRGIALFTIMFLLLALLALTIGIGYLLGAGAGWIAFGLICLAVFLSALRTLKDKAEAEGK